MKQDKKLTVFDDKVRFVIDKETERIKYVFRKHKSKQMENELSKIYPGRKVARNSNNDIILL